MPSEPPVAMRIGLPDRLMAGAPARIGLQLTERTSNEPVTDIIESHERPLHLIVVSDDLEHFQHLHPWPAGDGLYLIDVTFASGRSRIFLEFLRSSGETVLVQDSIDVGNEPERIAVLRPSDSSTDVDGFQVRLHAPPLIQARRPTEFVAEVFDLDSGAPVTALSPYLGAAAHVVIIDADAQAFGHAHAVPRANGGSHQGEHPAAGAHAHGGEVLPPRFGPGFEFRHTFPHGGTYRLWIQFGTPARAVATVHFDIHAGP